MKKKSRQRRGHEGVNLRDVARHAGVSPMTASRVIGNIPTVGETYRRRVEAAIRKLGYQPNAAARTLASAGTRRIGIMYGNPSASYSSELLVSLLSSSGDIGCQLFIEKCSSRSRERAAARHLIGQEVGGVILQTPLCDSMALLRHFEDAGIPTLAAGTGREDAQGLSIRIDNRRAAAEMTRYLLSLGHRRIGFIVGHPDMIDSKQRYEGFEEVMTRAGLDRDENLVWQGQYTYRSGLAAAEEMLTGSSRPSAIFASNDEMAAGVLAAAHKLRLDVPGDLSVVGFDDAPLASTIWPALTTIRQPIDAITKLALTMLIDEIRNRRNGKPPARVQEVVKLKLVKRESAAPWSV